MSGINVWLYLPLPLPWEWTAVIATGVIGILLLWLFWSEEIPTLSVDTQGYDDDKDTVKDYYIFIPRKRSEPQPDSSVRCYDPSTMDYLGFCPALKKNEVEKHVQEARAAQKIWEGSSFRQRRKFLRILQQYILDHQEQICRISARDSGKCLVDAGFGEIFTTCEKISWLLKEGERHLRTEFRAVGRMMPHKVARVEYRPLGVLGAIVPWNYPFHNIFNPMLAAVFSGNAIVIKVSEHTSWSAGFYLRIILAALKAAGAPPGLVHIVTGYGATGEALVRSGVDKITFVGSTAIGKRVMAAAADSVTPVVLELGGKDAFIVCDDADLEQVVPIALRAAFQCSGQNCVAAERFYIHRAVYSAFTEKVLKAAGRIRMGIPLEGQVDMGSLCLAQQCERLLALVGDAVSKGAKLALGGDLALAQHLGGQFFPPTVLLGVDHSMRIMQEEVFGPIMAIACVESDDMAVQLANDSLYGLGCSIFSGSKVRANRIAARIRCGVININDFASSYMCQALPFGGVKESGFDRFAGIEGLRGCCCVRAVVEDRWPFLKTRIPKPLQYPVAEVGFDFQQALVRMFYGATAWRQAMGLVALLKCLVWKKPTASDQEQAAKKRHAARGGER